MDGLLHYTMFILSTFYNTVSSGDHVIGVQFEFLKFYDSGRVFTCLDKLAIIPFSSVNDNYCDCRDSSDEPGTSACPDGKFYCQNNAYIGNYIQSSRVNDGICDCCDGTDEYDTAVDCSNTCDKHEKEALIKLHVETEISKKGFAKKVEMVRVAHETKIEKEKRIAVLNVLLENQRLELEQLRIAKESSVALEKEAKDRHQKLWDEEKAKGFVVKDSTKYLVPEKDNEERHDKLGNIKETNQTPSAKGEDKIREYDENTKILIKSADNARYAFEVFDKEMDELKNEHREIRDLLALDLGLDKEFMSLKGECFEFDDHEYTYKLCLFVDVTQRHKFSGSETKLGVWGTWGRLPMKYFSMLYSNGNSCWNGPVRSTKVNFICGVDNILVAVSEPSRCEYEMEFHTPAVCEAASNAHTEL